MTKNKNLSKVAGGKARSKALPAKARSEIAKKAADARWNKDASSATHEAEIKLGDLVIECAVLEDGRRVISERAMTRAFGGKRGGSHWKRIKEGGANLPVYLSARNYFPFIDKGLQADLTAPIKYKTLHGSIANGVEAALLPKVCDVFLKTRDADALHPSQVPMSIQADIITRGLAAVGIVALIDEATGYQKDRANDALAEIMEAFVAKELQAWVKTFPDSYYEEIHRLRDLKYPPERVGKWPQYFGKITNDIVYDRLAPGIKEALKSSVPKDSKGRHKTQLHRKLTKELGHPKLKEYMASLITIMKLSTDYSDFKEKLDSIHEKYEQPPQLDLRGGKGRGLKS